MSSGIVYIYKMVPPWLHWRRLLSPPHFNINASDDLATIHTDCSAFLGAFNSNKSVRDELPGAPLGLIYSRGLCDLSPAEMVIILRCLEKAGYLIVDLFWPVSVPVLASVFNRAGQLFNMTSARLLAENSEYASLSGFTVNTGSDYAVTKFCKRFIKR